MPTLRLASLTGEAEKATKTTVDTIEITPKIAASWKSPPFQREVQINQKVKRLTDSDPE